MKTMTYILLVVVSLMSCRKDFKTKNDYLTMSYSSNGTLKSIIANDEKNEGFHLYFTDNEQLEIVGHHADSNTVGIINHYHNNKLVRSTQKIILDGKEYVNQIWSYDEFGVLNRNESNFFSIGTHSDTIEINNFWEAEVFLDCPIFYDQMDITIGNYDNNFHLIDSTGFLSIKGEDFKCQLKIQFMHPGENIIRGVISDYILINDSSVYKKERKNFFEKKVFVINK